jgi:Lipase (class 3)
MKKKMQGMLAIACLFIIGNVPLSAQTIQQASKVQTLTPMTQLKSLEVKGTNVFSTSFGKTAKGRNDMNAYLLCYLTTLIYPQYLSIVAGDPSDAFINKMHSGGVLFENEYKKRTSFLFSNPEYRFVTESYQAGYDPEAMVISTSDVIYVVFRGTDRVATNIKNNPVGSFMYDWGEWLLSDFDARLLSPPELVGKVHAGFWNSLSFNGFKDKLLQQIIDMGGNSKKVWITGHSLGAAQAQVFAMYMAKKGITAQGVYVYAAPHPGTEEFRVEMNQLFPNQRLQRFDFSSDPITTLAPYVLGYRRSGTRVFYKDIKSIDFGAEERSPLEAAALISGISGAVGFNIAGSQMCYHHPTWYLRAAYTQLSTTERDNVPAPLPLPDPTTTNGYSEACDVLSVNKGKNAGAPGSLVEEGIVAIGEALEKLKFTAQTILDNVTGTAITEGDYYIQSYASNGKLGLNETDGFENGSSLRLTTAKSKVKIQRFGAVGYTIRFGTKTVNGFFGEETKEYVLDSKAEDLFDDGSTTIQLWEKNALPAVSANQRWLFIKVNNTTNKYILKNIANGKLLDANNACINGTDCGVKTWAPVTDDQTQIWILEKAN